MDWWEEEPLRIFQIGGGFVSLANRDAVQIAKDVDKVSANVQQLHCMGGWGGLDDKKLFFNASVARAINRDYITGQDSHSHSRLLEGITRKYLPAPTYGIKVEISTARKVISFYERLKGRYDGIPALSSDPFLLINAYGKGKALYLAGTCGEMLYRFRFQEYYRLASNMANLLSRRLIDLEDVPSSLEVILRQKENKLSIHLINFTAEMKRPIERIIPLHNVKICLNYQGDPGALKALWKDEELPFEKTPARIIFSIPTVNKYEVVMVAGK